MLFDGVDSFKSLLAEKDLFIEELRLQGDTISKAKIEALCALFTAPRVRLDVSCGLMPIDIMVYKGKMQQIREAETKQDLKDILSIPKVHYNGCKIVPSNKWVLPAEELIMWSNTSLKAPLNDEGYQRFMELFKMVMPDKYEMAFGNGNKTVQADEGNIEKEDNKVIPLSKKHRNNPAQFIQLSLFDLCTAE